MSKDGFNDFGSVRGKLTTAAAQEVSPKLKQLAGMIQGLSYREMKSFAEQVADKCPNDDHETITEALLEASDKFLVR